MNSKAYTKESLEAAAKVLYRQIWQDSKWESQAKYVWIGYATAVAEALQLAPPTEAELVEAGAMQLRSQRGKTDFIMSFVSDRNRPTPPPDPEREAIIRALAETNIIGENLVEEVANSILEELRKVKR